MRHALATYNVTGPNLSGGKLIKTVGSKESHEAIKIIPSNIHAEFKSTMYYVDISNPNAFTLTFKYMQFGEPQTRTTSANSWSLSMNTNFDVDVYVTYDTCNEKFIKTITANTISETITIYSSDIPSECKSTKNTDNNNNDNNTEAPTDSTLTIVIIVVVAVVVIGIACGVVFWCRSKNTKELSDGKKSEKEIEQSV